MGTKADNMSDEIKQKIEGMIKDNRVMLFMKGSPTFPQCGFSGQAVQILNMHNVEFGSFDVLGDMDIRQGIKEFSDWPTIPQLYVDGEFVGGCDIITQMHTSGDLEKLLAPAKQGS